MVPRPGPYYDGESPYSSVFTRLSSDKVPEMVPEIITHRE